MMNYKDMKILITGATGLIGKQLVKVCRANGIAVNYLTTSKDKLEDADGIKGFFWNPDAGVIDNNCFANVTAIIHLAGASIAKPWSVNYKQQIVESRTVSAKLLFTSLKKITTHHVTHVISASGVGVYPNSFTNYYSEDYAEIDDSFVGEVVRQWESVIDDFEMLGIKIAKVRTGLVLAANGGFLDPMAKSVKFYLGAPLATGKQWLSWIHIEDLVNVYMHILQKELVGIYNAVAPNPVTNKKLTSEIGKVLRKPIWPFHVPKFVLKLVFGDMSYLLTCSQRVDASKIQQTGYIFKYTNSFAALQNLLKSDKLF